MIGVAMYELVSLQLSHLVIRHLYKFIGPSRTRQLGRRSHPN
jgi:hypothetical protein